MSEYHKIQTIFKRDMASRRKTLREGDWTLPEFEYLARNAWTFTEKVDGTNIRVIFKDGTVAFGGRTEDAEIPVPRLRCRLMARLRRIKCEGGCGRVLKFPQPAADDRGLALPRPA